MNQLERQRKRLAIILLLFSIVLAVGAFLQMVGTILLVIESRGPQGDLVPTSTGRLIIEFMAEVSFLVIAVIVYHYARKLYTQGSRDHVA